MKRGKARAGERPIEKFVPQYYRIAQSIITQIENGALATGDRVPSENEIRSAYAVSSTTARKVLADLAAGGWISKVRGKGSFVGKPLIDRNIARITSFTRNVEQMGLKSLTLVLSQSVHLEKEVRMRVGDRDYILSPPYLHVLRLRLGDQVPIMIENRYISLGLCPGLESKDLSQSLFEMYEETYGCVLLNSRQSISSVPIDEQAAEQLDCAPGLPGFLVEGVLFTTRDRLLELEHSVYRGDRYRFVIDATK
jgi:GntR family transcriptional regulator